MSRLLYLDCIGGAAGDMLLGALLDAGAALAAVQDAVAAVVPGEVAVHARVVQRAGLRAMRAEVASTAREHPHRAWPDLRALLTAAPLPAGVREPALAVFARLADAEARVHGIDPDRVQFHEVGAWDSIADVVGVCAALADLGVTELTASPVAVGSGRVRTAHGDLPVPAPAVLDLARGWEVTPGGAGELATPTGLALVRELAVRCGPLPAMAVAAVGIGAGGRDVPERANVTRVVLGRPADSSAAATMWVLETNVDDLDPRVWPTALGERSGTGEA
jgi:pyridinium-3,5-bisthiocarboxylic acid mononucleotide nickel chelatase